MKVLVLNSMAPFVWGGAEELADNLVRQLNATPGVESELLRLPFQWLPAERLPLEIYIHRTFQIFNADRVIALKFPAYLVPHERKTLWLLHQFRQGYDGEAESYIPETGRGGEIRRLIRENDTVAFREASRIFVNSEITRRRLMAGCGVDGTVLLPPVNDPELFTGGEATGYVFAGGRINDAKRQHLLVEAMRHVRSGVRLVVAGPPDTPADGKRLRNMIDEHGLHGRVTLDLRLMPRAEVARYVNGALACAYLPWEEDSVGYVTMEAFTAAKAVITTADSGGLRAIVEDGRTGWVVAPEPRAIAEALDAAIARPGRTAELGATARDVWNKKGVTWRSTIEKLLS